MGMQERGVRWISYFQVDNPLVPVCDPAFIGYHVLAGAEMSAKVVRKASWDEKVGVIGRRDERLSVIEYSDLPEERARETESDGSLRWWAGSIAIHIFSVDFVARLNDHGFRLPFHVARRRFRTSISRAMRFLPTRRKASSSKPSSSTRSARRAGP